jgi:hypothetical protein
MADDIVNIDKYLQKTQLKLKKYTKKATPKKKWPF